MVTHSSILVLENPKVRRAQQAIVHRDAKSWTWLKQLNTHAQIIFLFLFFMHNLLI